MVCVLASHCLSTLAFMIQVFQEWYVLFLDSYSKRKNWSYRREATMCSDSLSM